MRQSVKLGLNQALVAVNRSALANSEPLEVFFQVNECFECPLEPLTTLRATPQDEFVIGTKWPLKLELRQSGSELCELADLRLNNQGLYQVNLVASTRSSAQPNATQEYDCSFATLDDGQCSLCPLALLLCFILLATFAERLLAARGATRSKQKLNSQEPADEEATRVVEAGEQQEGAAEQLATANEEQRQQRAPRVEALDAFRGLTIAGMIMVNWGGAGYAQLEHQPWDGLTCADLVFPFFIFSMGASVALSVRRLFVRGRSASQMLAKIARRALILLALGLCLSSRALRGLSLNHLRIPGILQRFSISYLVVASMFTLELFSLRYIKSKSFCRAPLLARTSAATIEVCTALLHLAIYLYFTFYFQYDDYCPVGYLGPGGHTENGAFANCTGGAAAWLDRHLLGDNHLYHDRELRELYKTQVQHDPEGLLGFTTSILLTLIGLQCGKSLDRFKEHKQRLIAFATWITVLALSSGLVVFIPINKHLFSLTFVTVTGCLAFLTFTALYLLMDVRRCKRTFLLQLLIAAGKNSILLYVAHGVLDGMLPFWFEVSDEASQLQLLARLTWAVFVWLLIAHYLASKKLFVKI